LSPEGYFLKRIHPVGSPGPKINLQQSTILDLGFKKPDCGRGIETTGSSSNAPIINASKRAFGTFSDTLRLELHPFGIHVSVVEPGAIKTPAVDKPSGMWKQ
jgi:NAD(P)-dependent dehydrogenase (short-subunit alcohol dehydrogenase family)